MRSNCFSTDLPHRTRDLTSILLLTAVNSKDSFPPEGEDFIASSLQVQGLRILEENAFKRSHFGLSDRTSDLKRKSSDHPSRFIHARETWSMSSKQRSKSPSWPYQGSGTARFSPG